MTAHLCVVGSLNMDLVAQVERMPKPGETILSRIFQMIPGGKGANQALAAARLRAHVSLVGRVGDDAFAALLLKNLDSDGVDRTRVVRDKEASTGVALIIVDIAGQNSIIVTPGANMCLSPADIEASEMFISKADALLLQLEIPLETVARAAGIAHAHHIPVILNPAPARPLPVDILSSVDILIPNESEATTLTNMPVRDIDEAEAAGKKLQTCGLRNVIITLGKQGALLINSKKVEHFPAFDVTPVDTTAAGDAFVAAFAVALAEGKAMDQAITWGNAAGALVITKIGAQPSLPTRRELENLLSTGIPIIDEMGEK